MFFPSIVIGIEQKNVYFNIFKAFFFFPLSFQKGQSGLDMAMKRRDFNLVKLLCYFGAEVTLQDWILLSGDINALDKQDQLMLKLILDQNDRLAAINHG